MTIGKKIKEFFKKSPEIEKKEEEKKEENLSQQFQLSEEEKKKIVDLIYIEVQDRENARSEFMQKREEGIKLYEGIRAPKTKPWKDASNISTMVTTIASDTLHAKLFPMSWTPNTIYWEGREEHDVDTAEKIRILMEFIVGPSEMAFETTVDEIIQRLIIDGTILGKIRWITYGAYITRRVPKKVLTFEQFMSGQVQYDIKYDYILREKGVFDLKDLERVYLKWDAHDEKDAEPIEEVWYTKADLTEAKTSGLIPNVNIDEIDKAMDDLPEFKGTQQAWMTAEGTVPVNTRKEAYKIKCYEAHIKYDINKDGVKEDCIFLVAANPKKYLGGKPLHAVSRIGKTCWIIRPFLKRPGRIYGKSVPELVMNLHKELDAIHNQRIDAGNMAIAPFFFYRSVAGTTPGNINVGPATGVPLDDPDRDVRFPQFPGYGLQVSFQEERIVMELIEKLTYLTPAMLGRELANRPTARGTLAVMAQGEQKFSLLARRCQYIIGDILTSIKQTYEQFMPPDLQSRILGDNKRPIFAYLSPETIAGQYDCKMTLDLTAGNLDLQRQIDDMVYKSMAMDPFVMQNPAYGWEIRADFLKSWNKKPVEKYIGPKPPTMLTEEDADDMFVLIQQGIKPPIKQVDARILNRLLEIRKSPAYEQLKPESKALFNEVLNEAKLFYVETMQERMAQYATTFGGAPEEEGIRTAGGFAQTPGMGLMAPPSPGGRVSGGGTNLPGRPQPGVGQGAEGTPLQ
jgi:hypothetical protein